MAYQFDPRPPGLHYEFRRIAKMPKPIWYLRDGAPHVWIDLQSLVQTLGISYVKWANAFRAQRFAWGLEACLDRNGRETILCPDQNVGQVLAMLLRGIGSHTSINRLQSLAAVWPTVRRGLRNADGGVIAAAASSKKGPSRARKVNAYCVRQTFKLLNAGHRKGDIAKALRISATAISKIANGTYDLDPEGWAAWRETFGAALTPGASLSPIFKPEAASDVSSHVQPDSGGVQSVFDGQPKTP